MTVEELIKGVNIALGNVRVNECARIDSSGDHEVTVNELIEAVRNALNGCPRLTNLVDWKGCAEIVAVSM